MENTYFPLRIRTFFLYLLFGFLHEIVHHVSFMIESSKTYVPINLKLFMQMCFGKYYPILSMEASDENSNLDEIIFEPIFSKHSGWIFSLAFAIFLSRFHGGRLALPAFVVAFEAVSSDLFGIGIPSSMTSNSVLFCGNFGVILLNDDFSKKILFDIIEAMIRVTMIRGAQTGGVVTYQEHQGYSTANRLRVVNGKRGDLAKGIKAKLALFNANPKMRINGVFGHTRFATSSVATKEGCHPHKWTDSLKTKMVLPINFGSRKCFKNIFRYVSIENFVTHNGDFDFFYLNDQMYDLESIQKWLPIVTWSKIPSCVDSAAIAGFLDLFRCQGSFLLSTRYALCFKMPDSTLDIMRASVLPSRSELTSIAEIFETVTLDFVTRRNLSFDDIASNQMLRDNLVKEVHEMMISDYHITKPYVDSLYNILDDEIGTPFTLFIKETINAFFDNDLFMSMKLFLASAKGSFGLCFTSNIDSTRQICIAALGQSMSIAFYPSTGIICYGSEQASTKAGKLFNASTYVPSKSKPFRIDLDDLSGEICLIDWNKLSHPFISHPNRHAHAYSVIDGQVKFALLRNFNYDAASNRPLVVTDIYQQESMAHRLVFLDDVNNIIPLPTESDDYVRDDLNDIPRICNDIQFDWSSHSLNRYTAYTLQRAIRQRLNSILNNHDNRRNSNTIDILVTGCEVSLWVAEQFASDLQKSFPLLCIRAVSSNKLLGMFGQEIELPATGFQMSGELYDLHNPICIIVSHSGGTFSPLALSSLFQGVTKHVFAITSDWDTPIGKQLKQFQKRNELFSSYIFSTGCGMRYAEPCSVTVAATHQLLTQIYQVICLTIIGNTKYKRISGAVVTQDDLEILEKCNQLNLNALEEIVGTDRYSEKLENSEIEQKLRSQGSEWAKHVLEVAKAHVLSFAYIFITVITGYPLFYLVYLTFGYESDNLFICCRILDAIFYFILPQINILLIRVIEGRDIRHRMVGRSVIVADIPWVSQCAETFLSKIFACSYSIAGINTHFGNPADHFVHRHTHRVVRGSLLVLGRPDGRLSALTSAEVATALSLSQACCIQSLGGTCESITIGHNPYKIPLSHNGIFLKSHRPTFLSEQILCEESGGKINLNSALDISSHGSMYDSRVADAMEQRTSNSLLAFYTTMSQRGIDEAPLMYANEETVKDRYTLQKVLEDQMKESSQVKLFQNLYDQYIDDRTGLLKHNSVLAATKCLNASQNAERLINFLFSDGREGITFSEFVRLAKTLTDDDLGVLIHSRSNRNDKGFLQVKASKERFFGEKLRKTNMNLNPFEIARSQHFAMNLYESRIASMQRFVAMTVMFHAMGNSVESFISFITLGMCSYKTSHTQSILRVATTASPVSAHHIKVKMRTLVAKEKIRHAVGVIERFWRNHASARKMKRFIHRDEEEKKYS